jgi:oligopeptide/dipeptide ABC transporter ATP-binding protein
VENLVVHYSPPRRVSAERRRLLRAVEGISFRISEGEAVGMVGESGCGKSTIAKVLVALQRPTSGSVKLRGKAVDFRTADGLRREVQMVFQDPGSSLNPRLRVGTQVAEPLRGHLNIRSRDELERRVAQLLEAVGLDAAVAERFPHQFSGGQRQRIALARALAVGPKLLVADEPMASLDVPAQAEISELLIKLRRDMGLALLLISHDLGGVGALTEKVIVVYLGRVMEEGPTSIVLSDGAHPYTRALLDAIPSLDGKGLRKRIVLTGDPPSPFDPPPGCAFHTRCLLAEERCRREVPSLVEVASGHKAACFLLENREGGSRRSP